jgi:hypothetical protein
MLAFFAIALLICIGLAGIKTGVSRVIANHKTHQPGWREERLERWVLGPDLPATPKEIDWDDFERSVQRVLEAQAKASPDTHVAELQCDVDAIIYRMDRDMAVDLSGSHKLQLKPSRSGATPRTPASKRLQKIVDDTNRRKALEEIATSSHKESGGTDFSQPLIAQLHRLMKVGVISRSEVHKALGQRPLEPPDPEAEPEF